MKKIVAVCGMGIGTSVLLKMNAEKVLRKIGAEAEISAADIAVAKTLAKDADILLTSAEIAHEFDDIAHPEIVVINNFTNLAEIESKLAPILL
ncbi:MAG: PTS sugar transporter subunit IIB [Cellulomonadaceae bacterium]|jgi:PTS system ascorbate-specific IIB component|nr:PTS sugar transporter subunit IIB [Cellulomonadaceae bacterium]